jgi:thiamine-phosphate pyrophosphorylase
VKSLSLNNSSPLIYLITDRGRLAHKQDADDLAALIDFTSAAACAGVDMIQMRERDLSAKALFTLTENIVSSSRPYRTRVLINDRADIAMASGAGVHLTTRSMTAETIRNTFGAEVLVGVSTHSLEEAEAAERGGADFIVFGPTFETESKKSYGPPVGLDKLEEVCHKLQIPVLALGGINLSNFHLALDRGASGIAAISLFTDADDLRSAVDKIKSYRKD